MAAKTGQCSLCSYTPRGATPSTASVCLFITCLLCAALPHVDDDGLICMDVDIQVISLQKFLNHVPLVGKLQAQLRVTIEKEHTLVTVA